MSRTFATLFENKSAGDYIIAKKTNTVTCGSSKCSVNNKFSSQQNKMTYQRSTNPTISLCADSKQLYINLLTKIDLSNVSVIEDFSGNVVPSTIEANINDPYLRYNIDPGGSLFGNNVCGINNYVNYMVYNYKKFKPTMPPTYPPFDSTNSVVTYDETTKIYVVTFLTDGTMQFKENVLMPTTVNYLLVGGGGSANYSPSSGGAGGDVIYKTNIYEDAPTTQITFNVAPTSNSNANGFNTSFSGSGIDTITAHGGSVGINSPNNDDGTDGSFYVINNKTYYFGGGGGGSGNNDNTNPSGGLGGGGGGGDGTTSNNSQIYYGPNGINQVYTQNSNNGYTNSGGGGGGSGSGPSSSGSGGLGGSGLVVVWFEYPPTN